MTQLVFELLYIDNVLLATRRIELSLVPFKVKNFSAFGNYIILVIIRVILIDQTRILWQQPRDQVHKWVQVVRKRPFLEISSDSFCHWVGQLTKPVSRLCGSNFWTLIIFLKSPNDLESRVNTNSTLISLWKLKFDIWTCLIRPNTSFYSINSPIFSNIMRLLTLIFAYRFSKKGYFGTSLHFANHNFDSNALFFKNYRLVVTIESQSVLHIKCIVLEQIIQYDSYFRNHR